MVCIFTIVWFVAYYESRSACLSMQWSKKTCIYSDIIIGKTNCNIANLPNGTAWLCVERHSMGSEFERIAYCCPCFCVSREGG